MKSHFADPKSGSLKFAGFDMYRNLHRRAIVVVTFASFGAGLVAANWVNQGPGHLLRLAGLPLFGVAALGFLALNRVARLYPDGSSRQTVDERQSTVRDRAYFQAYQVICALVTVALGYCMVAPQFSLWLPASADSAPAIFLVFLFSSITVPNAFIAWNEPDFEQFVD